MLNENEEKMILEMAKECGFSAAAFMDSADLVIMPEYRKYCEMNLCGCYDKNPACPPACGTVEELTAKVRSTRRVLVLQTVIDNDFKEDPGDAKFSKNDNNQMADELAEKMHAAGIRESFRMSAGPWKQVSCMSAYCVNAQKMADSVGMDCWVDDGKSRFFSQMLFD